MPEGENITYSYSLQEFFRRTDDKEETIKFLGKKKDDFNFMNCKNVLSIGPGKDSYI